MGGEDTQRKDQTAELDEEWACKTAVEVKVHDQ